MVSVAAFGGNATGRKRADGLRPGSPEAEEADRKKDRLRKQAARAVLPVPAVLPAPAPAPLATPGNPALLPAGLPLAPAVAWVGEDLEFTAEELIALLEELAAGAITSKMLLAKLPPDVVKEIEKDARWSDRAKRMLKLGGSKLSAKYLNEFGVPVEIKPWLDVMLAAFQILLSHVRIIRRIDLVIAEQKRLQIQTPAPAAKS